MSPPVTDGLDALLDRLGIPDEDSEGYCLDLKERLRRMESKWAEMKARDEAYGHKEPVEELLRVRSALLCKEHPDAHAAHFVREVCSLFDFAEPPPMPDNLWYRTALSVIRERVIHLEWPWKDPPQEDTPETKSS